MDENWRTQTDEKRRPDGEEKRVDEQRECDEQWHFTQGLRVPYVLVYSREHFRTFRGPHGLLARVLGSLHQDRGAWHSDGERNDSPH